MKIQKFLAANHTYTQEEELLEYKIKTLVLLTIVIAITVFIMGIIRFTQSNYVQAIADAVFIIVIIMGNIRLRHSKKNYVVVSRVIAIFGMGIVLLVLHSAELSEGRITWIAIMIVMIYFLRDRVEGALLSGIFVMMMGVLQILNPNIFHLSTVDFVIVIINIVLVSAVMLWYEKIKQNREEQLIVSKEKLEKLVQTRTQELKIALDVAQVASNAKSNFLANMSHELRTPMNAIIGMSYVLLQEIHESKQRKNIQTLHNSALSLLDIINDILDFSKIEADQLEIKTLPFHLDDTLQNISNIMEAKSKKKSITLVVKVDDAIPKALVGDVKLLKQVFVNLLDNALKFSDKGSEVIFGIEMKKEDEESVCLHFYVKDSGIGMTKGEQESLFEPFNQVDMSNTRKYGGIGLGLAISKRLIKLMNGEIWVESTHGVGSVFHINLCFMKKSKQIEAYTKKNNELYQAPTVKQDITDFDKENFLNMASELRSYLEDSDTYAITIYEKLQLLTGLEQYSAQFDKLELAINTYNFDEAIELLDILRIMIEGKKND